MSRRKDERKHLLRFESIPGPAFNVVQDKLDAAVQLLAALVLTDEEAGQMICEADSHMRLANVARWASRMHQELLSDGVRDRLVAAIRANGFLTNTHPGFPLGALEALPNHRALAQILRDFEALIVAHANGEGEYPDDAVDGLQAHFIRLLVEKGHEEHFAAHALDVHTSGSCYMAHSNRIMLVFHKQTVQERLNMIFEPHGMYAIPCMGPKATCTYGWFQVCEKQGEGKSKLFRWPKRVEVQMQVDRDALVTKVLATMKEEK